MSAPGRQKLLVFVRVPVPGRIGTRLIDALGEQGAAAFEVALLRRTQEAAGGLAEIERNLWWDGAPAPVDPAAGLAAACGMITRAQRCVDFGERIGWVLRQTLVQGPGGAPDRQRLRGLRQPLSALGLGRVGTGRCDARTGQRRRLCPDRPALARSQSLRRPAPGRRPGVGADRARLETLGWHWRKLPCRPDIERPANLAEHPGFLAAARGERGML